MGPGQAQNAWRIAAKPQHRLVRAASGTFHHAFMVTCRLDC